MYPPDGRMSPWGRRILVVGCGAMGGVVAAYLSRVADVTGIDIDESHVQAIRTGGLRLVHGGEDFVAPLRAETDARKVRGECFDAVLLLVKSGQTAAALSALPGLAGPPPLFVTLQNGMGNSELLEAIAVGSMARGVVLDAARFVGPGCVEHLVRGQSTWIGPVRGSMGDCAWLAELMSLAGLPARLLADPMEAAWPRLVYSAVTEPVDALLAGVGEAQYASPEICALVDEMAQECSSVVLAMGARFAFDPMGMVRATRAGLRPMGRHAGPMARDIAAGRATEIDELTGFIVAQARRLGIAVPMCEAVYRLVKGLEVAHACRVAEPQRQRLLPLAS